MVFIIADPFGIVNTKFLEITNLSTVIIKNENYAPLVT